MRLPYLLLPLILALPARGALVEYKNPAEGVRIEYDDAVWRATENSNSSRDVLSLMHVDTDTELFLTLFHGRRFEDKGPRQMFEADVPWFEDTFGKPRHLTSEAVEWSDARAHRAEFDGAEQHVLRYTLVHDGCLVLFGYTSRIEDSTRVRSDFEKVKRTFAWIPRQAAEEAEPWAQTAEYRLPITGKWDVSWGGPEPEQNLFHRNVSNQRFAYDLVTRDASGGLYAGDGARNEDYYGFDRPVVAAADGLVVEAIDGVHDCAPGITNTFSIVGNCVVIEHASREYSLTAHLRQGSVVVRKGDRVKAGDMVGRCGNSGNSSGPHIHFHVMDRPEMELGRGQEVEFSDLRIVRDGKEMHLQRGEPVRGDRVSNAP